MEETAALSAGPDVVFVVRPQGDEEPQEMTVTWDQSFMDVLNRVQDNFQKRFTLQFVHRVPMGGSSKAENFTETTVKVEDDEMFDVMIEFALEQPDRRLEVELVETHWWPKDGVDNFLERDDFDEVTCAPIARCCNRHGECVALCNIELFLTLLRNFTAYGPVLCNASRSSTGIHRWAHPIYS